MVTLLLVGCHLDPEPDDTPVPGDDSTADTSTDTSTESDDSGDSVSPDDTAPDTAEDTAAVGTDSDGDGVSAEVGDCDDGNPWVYPGAEERCDTLDHDCEGAPLAAGVCAKEQAAEQLWTTSWTPDAAWAEEGVYVAFGQPGGFVGDLDGDGKSEVLASCDNCSWFTTGSGGSNAYLLPGGTVGRDLEPISNAITWWTGSEGYIPGAVMELGDWNGDGSPDMAMTTGEGGGQEGVVRILYGPPSRWPSGVDASAAADVRFYAFTDFGFGGTGITHGDLDGDGLSDILATSLQDSWGASSTAALRLLYGRTDAVVEPDVDEEPWLAVDPAASWIDALNLGDMDGDGADDLVVVTYNDREFSFATLSGAVVRAGAGEDISELAGARLTSESGHICVTSAGDLDGDGLADWVAGLTDADSNTDDPGALYAVSGAHQTGGTAESIPAAAEGWWTGTLERAIGTGCGSGDIDADGTPELFVERADIVAYRDNDYQWAVARTHGMPAPGDHFPQSLVLLRPYEDEAWRSLYMSQVPSVGDYDGDGFNDILLSGYHDSDEIGMGGFVIIPGWDVPWDDPTYW